MTDRIVFYELDSVYEAWADVGRRDYLGSFDTEAEARDALRRADESEDAYERAYEESVRESARTRQLFGYPR